MDLVLTTAQENAGLASVDKSTGGVDKFKPAHWQGVYDMQAAKRLRASQAGLARRQSTKLEVVSNPSGVLQAYRQLGDRATKLLNRLLPSKEINHR